MMYSVSMLWTDNFENSASDALGYRLIGFTSDEALATKVRTDTPIISKGRCWAMDKDMPLYVVKEYNELTSDSEELDLAMGRIGLIFRNGHIGRTKAP